MKKNRTIKKVIDICNVRKQFNKSCHNCIYVGKQCEHVCKILKVNKPYEYITQHNDFIKKED